MDTFQSVKAAKSTVARQRYSQLQGEDMDSPSQGYLPYKGVLETSVREISSYEDDIIETWTLKSILVNVFSGIFCVALVLVAGVSIVQLIFVHERLLPHVNLGFFALGISGVVVNVFVVFRSKTHMDYTAPDIFLTFFLSGIASSAADNALTYSSSEEVVLSTTIAALVLTGVFAGLVLMIATWLGVSKVAAFVPYPVTAGFVVSIGLMLYKGGFSMACGETPAEAFNSLDGLRQAFILMLPTILLSAGFRLTTKLPSSVALFGKFGLVVVSSAIAYLTLFILGISYGDAGSHHHIFLEVPEGGHTLFESFGVLSFRSVQWDIAVRATFTTSVVMCALFLIKISLMLAGVERTTKKKIDYRHSVMLLGYSNVLASLVGGFITSTQALGMITINVKNNASSRVPTIIAVLGCAIFAITGSTYIKYIPRFVFGALLVDTGTDITMEWMIRSARRMSKSEYGILLITAGMGLVVETPWDIPVGVAVGSLLSLILYLKKSVHFNGIRPYKSGRTVKRRSHVDRPMSHNSILDDNTDAIHIVRLQGYLFFCSVPKITNELISIWETNKNSRKQQFLILDFAFVNELDSSAALQIQQACQLGHDVYRVHVIISAATQRHQRALMRTGVDSKVRFNGDMDHGLEHCEEMILYNVLGKEYLSSQHHARVPSQQRISENVDNAFPQASTSRQLSSNRLQLSTSLSSDNLLATPGLHELSPIVKPIKLAESEEKGIADFTSLMQKFDAIVPNVSEELSSLWPYVELIKLNDGDVWYSQGQEMHYIAFIRLGVICHSNHIEDPKTGKLEYRQKRVFAPAAFGASSLATRRTPSDVVAEGYCEIYRLHLDTFAKIEKIQPGPCLALYKLMSRLSGLRIFELQEQVTYLRYDVIYAINGRRDLLSCQ